MFNLTYRALSTYPYRLDGLTLALALLRVRPDANIYAFTCAALSTNMCHSPTLMEGLLRIRFIDRSAPISVCTLGDGLSTRFAKRPTRQ